jgi:uncharacterized protein involved in exopolysaccharide biosynthesis
MAEQRLEYDEEAGEGDANEGLDRVKELLGFALRSTRRHATLAILTFVVVSATGITIARALPRSYLSEVRISVQQSAAMRTLSGSKLEEKSVDNPMRGVSAMILRRDNIVALVDETHLVRQFDLTRAPLLKFKDRILSSIGPPQSADAKEHALIGLVENKLYVKSDDSSVTIGIEWPDPQLAYELVTMVQKNFLEARYDSDVSEITESLGVLKEHAQTELAKVDQALAEYKKALEDYRRDTAAAAVPDAALSSGGAIAVSRPRGDVTPARVVAPIDPDVEAALEEKRARIRTIEADRERNLAALKQQLAQAQLTLTPLHPTVITLQQAVDAASQPSAELLQLKAEQRTLMAQIAPPTAPSEPASMSSATPAARMLAALALSPAPAPAAAREPSSSNPLEGPNGPVRLAHANLELAIGSYANAMQRIDSASVELDITKTAYKHRYTILTPAEVPRGPMKSIATVLSIGGIIGGALLGVFLAGLSDILKGRLLEAWQIRRQLKVEILGEIDLLP